MNKQQAIEATVRLFMEYGIEVTPQQAEALIDIGMRCGL